MVNVSAVWTPAEAAAGGTPMLISKVLEIWPKAMPSAPSTSCAAKPIRMKGSSVAGSANIDERISGLHPVDVRAVPNARAFGKAKRPQRARARLAFAATRTYIRHKSGKR